MLNELVIVSLYLYLGSNSKPAMSNNIDIIKKINLKFIFVVHYGRL